MMIILISYLIANFFVDMLISLLQILTIVPALSYHLVKAVTIVQLCAILSLDSGLSKLHPFQIQPKLPVHLVFHLQGHSK
jgi:hypothetical protein